MHRYLARSRQAYRAGGRQQLDHQGASRGMPRLAAGPCTARLGRHQWCRAVLRPGRRHPGHALRRLELRLHRGAGDRVLSGCPKGCVLISHSPPKGAVDVDSRGRSLGSVAVRDAVDRQEPLLVVCGHIHACAGQHIRLGRSVVVNAGPAGVEWEVCAGSFRPVGTGLRQDQATKELVADVRRTRHAYRLRRRGSASTD
jgi:hypothetical protein